MKKDKRTPLEVQRDRLLDQQALCQTNCDAYEGLSKELEKIYEIMEKEKKSKNRVDPNTIFNTIATVGANLVGIGLVLKFEELRIIPHKAFQMIKRLF